MLTPTKDKKEETMKTILNKITRQNEECRSQWQEHSPECYAECAKRRIATVHGSDMSSWPADALALTLVSAWAHENGYHDCKCL